MTKQEYNRLYYQKNKDRWAQKKKEGPLTNVFHIFKKSPITSLASLPPAHHWTSFLNGLEIFVLLVFVGIMTAFLIREAASFYLDANESQMAAYLKAGLLEGTAVLFSFSKSRHLLLKWAQRITVVMLCGFSLWIMSGKVVKNAVGETLRVQTMKANLRQLESELTQKERLRDQFLTRGRLTMTRRYEKGVDQIRNRLIAARQEVAKMQAPQVIANGLSILIAFRLLLVIVNLICIHRIVEKMNAANWQKEVRHC